MFEREQLYELSSEIDLFKRTEMMIVHLNIIVLPGV